MKYLTAQFVAIALLAAAIAAAPKARRYPVIKRASITIETTPSKLEEGRKLIIKDSHGRPAYELWITAISMDKRTTHSVHLSLETTGILASDPEGKYEPNLLSPDYWGHGKGREEIHPEEVCAANRNNPVVGARREFDFRRMRIMVSVGEIDISSDFCSEKDCGNQVGGFTRLRLTVMVEPGTSTRRRPAGYDELGWHYLDLKKCK